MIFVFGSNLAGRHGKGAARTAHQFYGAVYGQGEGMQGSSYAIPTKDERLCPLPLEQIQQHVFKFITFAKHHPKATFKVTRVGCGLAGYSDEEIAPFFRFAPSNCILPDMWMGVINALSSPRPQ